MDSAYLLLGPENGEKQKRLQEIRSEIQKLTKEEPECHRFHPFDMDEEELFSALDNGSLFSSHRLVLISQAESLSASQTDTLIRYLAHPSSETTLVLISDQTSLKAPRLTALIPKRCTRIFWELFDNQKSDWIRSFFRSRGLTITGDAIETLLELVNNNTAELKTTASQLALFWQTEKKSGPIDEKSVESYIQHTRSESAFTLFPALIKRDLRGALRVIRSILAQGDSGSSIVTHAGLLWSFRKLSSFFLQMEETGGNWEESFAGTTVMGARAAVTSYRDRNLYKIARQNFTLADIRNILIMLGEADIALKEAGEMKGVVWETLCHRIIVDKGAPTEPFMWVFP